MKKGRKELKFFINILVASLCFASVGCGQRGPLYLPDTEQQKDAR